MNDPELARLDRLRLLLAERSFDAAVLACPANIAAFFGGAETSLGFRQEPPGRIALCISPTDVTILGNRTEVARTLEDELPPLTKLRAEACNWDAWELKRTVRTFLDRRAYGRVCDDIGAFGEDVRRSLEAMYYPLSPAEIKALRGLAADTARIVESVARQIRPQATEAQVAGDLAGRLIAECIRPELIMIAADERVERLRHCNPGNAAIQSAALVSATVHRRGLYASLTRLVAIGKAPESLLHAQQACNRVDATAIASSHPGTPVSEVFRAMLTRYREEQVPDEWMMHHQGGPAGFYGRDFKATTEETRLLAEGQPVVWNPTIHGAKSEDTILTRTGGELPEILTHTGTWEYNYIATGKGLVPRPAVLVIKLSCDGA